ncbi:hypothetical protein [Leifsonia sp. 22587]|uniref:hypothetical protein n=1 Tax=Leifsonia sp. 22587 TaxID=3453946 RepID=UPI003F8468A3
MRDGTVVVLSASGLTLTIDEPFVVETIQDANIQRFAVRYTAGSTPTSAIASVCIGDATITTRDRWDLEGSVLHLSRAVAVSGNVSGGFATSLEFAAPWNSTDDEVFAPGIAYGDFSHINPFALGGEAWRRAGITDVTIREDRLTAPVLGVRDSISGAYVALMHVDPDGATSMADASGASGNVLVDPRVHVGALGWRESSRRTPLHFTYPALEGPVTYRGDTFPDGQMHQWRRRYHPLNDGHEQRYKLKIRFGTQSRSGFVAEVWRWAWKCMRPQTLWHDIEHVRSVVSMHASSVVMRRSGRAGFPLMLDAVTGGIVPGQEHRASWAMMGFTGRNTELAAQLLEIAARSEQESVGLRAAGEDVLNTFVELPVSPPAGEGFDLATGALRASAPWGQPTDVVFLRSLAEGGKGMVRAWRAERHYGRDHPGWIAWAMALGEWLLTQEDNGRWPRTWAARSGAIADASPATSYTIVPFLAEMYEATHDGRYIEAAVRAGQFSWSSEHQHFVYRSGTLDNPGVVDGEAGSIALEGYLALHGLTGESLWLDRAQSAAAFAETWIYIWDVPMIPTIDLEWPIGVPTTGLQLIATGHSLVHQYMSADAGRFAQLFELTGESHYRDVAQILLHNTKAVLDASVGGGLAGAGWQQEHWSLAPTRGRGLHRSWLPWIDSAHLEGILSMESRAPRTYRELTVDRPEIR